MIFSWDFSQLTESLLSLDPCKQSVEEPYLGITLDCEKKEHRGGLTLNSLALFFSEP